MVFLGRAGKIWPTGQILPVFVNQVLLEHNSTHLFSMVCFAFMLSQQILVVTTETICLRSLKWLLFGFLRKKKKSLLTIITPSILKNPPVNLNWSKLSLMNVLNTWLSDHKHVAYPAWDFPPPHLQEEKRIQMMSNVGINHHSDSQPMSNGLRDADYFRVPETPAPRMGL